MTPRGKLLGALARLFRTTPAEQAPHSAVRGAKTPAPTGGDEVGRSGSSATVEIAPPLAEDLRILYAPERDGDPDAGEIVWTWVPYTENDGRGKDRPVLVIGRQNDERVFAVRLTSKARDDDHDFLGIGTGPWDSKGRQSWVDIDHLYSVHVDGMRREASALDFERFVRVADALQRRYGWAVGN